MEIVTRPKTSSTARPAVLTTILVLLVLSGLVLGQNRSGKEEECPEKKRRAKTVKTVRPAPAVRVLNGNFTRAAGTGFGYSPAGGVYDERTMAVNPKVYVSLCVVQGSVKVNGWDRDEARVFVVGKRRNGLGFKVREREWKNKQPVWIQVLGFDPGTEAETADNTCLSGDIELDLPRNASVTIENSKGESKTTVDSVRAAKIEVLGGDIYLNNIADRIDARTFQGGVTVRNSSGKMFLTTTTGNIVAYNTGSSEIGDYFKAKTRSGAITLQSVDQKEVESSSISGTINYVGNISSGGSYGFSTTNGSINLAIPAETSCYIVAAYGGSFQSELPLTGLVKERTESLVYLKGKIGKGEANLNLRSFNGAITIRERKGAVLAGL